MIGLCDCNSFFASSERVFRPDLNDRGIVVLSNNDGIIVAADRKAKDLGFDRGANWFEVKDKAETCKIAAFSSNYTLYQDLSNRVMNTLSSLCPDVDPYSIDEAFFEIPCNLPASELRRKITNNTGIPVSVGYARTKTLVKITSKIAKKRKDFAFELKAEDEDAILSDFPVNDVWGVGWSWGEKLPKIGVRTAKSLRDMDDDYVLKHYPITLMRTIYELRGIDAHIESDKRISLRSGITFKEPVYTPNEMIDSLTIQAETLSRKLNEKNLLASTFGINFFSSRFMDNFSSPYAAVKLEYPTSYLPNFAKIIEALTPRIFQPGGRYKGCRVFAFDLIEKRNRQYSLFDSVERIEKEDKLSSIVSEVNKKYGITALQIGPSMGETKADLMKREMKSPYYTTRFEELCPVY